MSLLLGYSLISTFRRAFLPTLSLYDKHVGIFNKVTRMGSHIFKILVVRIILVSGDLKG